MNRKLGGETLHVKLEVRKIIHYQKGLDLKQRTAYTGVLTYLRT